MKIALFCILSSISIQVFSQSTDSSTISKHPSRIWLAAGAHAVTWTGSFITLNKAWYAKYPKQSFHFFNDFREWNQMDKAGHTWTAYQLARGSFALWEWAGLNKRSSTWYGSAAALAYQGMIEMQDGFSSHWGFSWTDMVANIAGIAGFAAQQLAWNEERISLKMSYHSPHYPLDLHERRNDLFGNTSSERILKDYNGQTYWASVNVKSFFPESNWPAWLNLAGGYGVEGILGGFDNTWKDKDGNTVSRPDIIRKRQIYFSPDIDFTKIRTKSKFLKTTFFLLNAIKMPAPALGVDSKGKFRAWAVYY